jgi:hypothetical protein
MLTLASAGVLSQRGDSPMSARLYWHYAPLLLALGFLAFIVAGIGNG